MASEIAQQLLLQGIQVWLPVLKSGSSQPPPCNCSSKDSDPLLWPPQALPYTPPQASIQDAHTQRIFKTRGCAPI